MRDVLRSPEEPGRRALRSTPIRMLLLAGMALIVAALSNRLAAPKRRLPWGRPALLFAPSPQPEAVPPPPSPAEAPVLERPSPPAPVRPRKGRVASAPAVPNEIPPFSPIQTISLEAAWKASQDRVPFLDARRGSEFAEGHVAGAWSVPVWEADLDDRLLAFKAARRPAAGDPIVIYCSGGDCRDSHLLADKLAAEGYTHLLIFQDGYPAWVAAGHPVERGRP